MKKKVLLLSTCAITSLAVAGGVVLLSNNDFNANKAKANTDFGLVRESVVAEDDYLTANCSDGKGNLVTTQFTGFTLANEYDITTQINSVAYFTNVNPMRGISNIYCAFEKESETTTHSLNFAVYASSNPLTISAINSGVHTDLFFRIEDYAYGTGKTISKNFDGLSKYRYVLIEVFTFSETYTLTELNYNVVCESEPEVVDVKTKTTWTEEEAADLASYGAPSDFPYPGVSGYNISNSQQMGVMVQTLVPHDNFLNITSFVYQEGYIVTMNVEAEGRQIMYMQKQNEDKSKTYTYGFNFKEMPGDLYSLQYLYSTTMEYMGESSTTWPKDKIAEVSANLSTAFPDFQLDDVKYQIVNIGGNPMSTEISIMVSSESSMVDKYVAYFNSLDTTLYKVSVNAGGYSYASTMDGQCGLSVYDMGDKLGVTLTEKKVYDHLPINEYAQYREYKLPEFTDVISGTFYFNDYGDIASDSITNEQFNQIVKLFTDIGFENFSDDPNYPALSTPITSNYDYNNLTVSARFDSGKFTLSFFKDQKDVNSKLSDALLLMTSYDDFNDYVAPITYVGEVTSIRYRVAYIENATSDTIQEVFDSINVDADSKFLSDGHIVYNLTINDEEIEVIIYYDLVDGVLYFTNIDYMSSK